MYAKASCNSFLYVLRNFLYLVSAEDPAGTARAAVARAFATVGDCAGAVRFAATVGYERPDALALALPDIVWAFGWDEGACSTMACTL